MGGARRDEEKVRSKERVFSFRDEFSQWARGARAQSFGTSTTGRTEGASTYGLPLRSASTDLRGTSRLRPSITPSSSWAASNSKTRVRLTRKSWATSSTVSNVAGGGAVSTAMSSSKRDIDAMSSWTWSSCARRCAMTASGSEVDNRLMSHDVPTFGDEGWASSVRSRRAVATDWLPARAREATSWLVYPCRPGLFRWRRSDSNRRPPACKAGALPTELRPLACPPMRRRCLSEPVL